MANRPKLPRPLERDVKVEAGDRCAIPRCGQHPIEIAHIEPRKADGSNDLFDNLIALCPTCHTRYDKGEIDRASMRRYKVNLSILNTRYGDLERRILLEFAEKPQFKAIPLPGGMGILIRYLLDDGLVRMVNRTELANPPGAFVVIAGVPSQEFVGITPKGEDFIARWLQAKDLEET